MPFVKQGNEIIEQIVVPEETVEKKWTKEELQAKCAECNAKIAGIQAEHQKYIDMLTVLNQP